MAFGCIMKLKTRSGLSIELAPFSREEVLVFRDGMQCASVLRYLNTSTAQTDETEQEWYDNVVKDKASIVWGVWAVERGKRTLVGNTALSHITHEPLKQAVSGIILTNSSYWGKGIASAAHRARTLYAFKQLRLVRIKSAVMHGNYASKKALEGVGYLTVYTERNEKFIDGALRHMDNMECLNPDDWAWRQWWGEDRPTAKAVEARKKTQSVLEWAEKNVELV